ncbi:hypothetical protein UFOVP118_15 [uncultured Caudovirales phage]|uniref:Uncharacterized protein n=1 Tax=uncultured Caudovirales phage TaxID=2100421 RepID=A0A6J5L5X9_9CAUD|nr:hypothetical protein UFOVP118_15 [uncultured Caudovirales phage]
MAHMAQTETGAWYLADDWHIDDVQSVRPDLNEDQCIHVLDVLADWFDANDGINWGVIEMTAENLYPQEDEE